MSRYIDKDKLLDDLNWHAPEPYKDSISDFIEEQPEADVVEVVRCKDCEHCKEGICGYTEGGHIKDWFCVKPVKETMKATQNIENKPIMKMSSVTEMIEVLKHVTEHLTDETDKGVINNCALLLQEISNNELRLIRSLECCGQFLNEYRELLEHIKRTYD